jgi:hypothetical protein
MSRAIVTQLSAGIFAPSPTMDAALLIVGDDLKSLERRIDQYEVDAIAWRANAISKLSKLDIAHVSGAQDRDAIGDQLTSTITVVENGLKILAQPLHADSAVADKVQQLGKASTGAGKFVRKLLRRLERIRIAQHAAHIDLYYGLLALKSELDGNPAETEEFSDPAKLGASLRKQLA